MGQIDTTNPAAIQARIERHSLDLAQEPVVRQAADSGAKTLLESIPDADVQSVARFPRIATEITLNALISLADGYLGEDLPRLIMRPPRRVGDVQVPGNRGLHDNPDTFYRTIPLDGDSDFVLDARVGSAPATIFEISALTEQWQTITNLTRADLSVEPGRHFRIHFGAAPVSGPGPGGAADHFVQLPADAEMLLVRETLADWAHERPSRLSVENRVDRGGVREGDDAARIETAARRVEKWFRESIRLTQLPLSQPANAFPPPVISGEHGKLVTMAYSIGHFRVRPGEALVLTIEPGSAEYVGIPITNLWGTTPDALARGASLNSKQTANNEDGTFTCVLAPEDPGVRNWLDPDGLERGFLFVRWAGLDPERQPERVPALTSRVVRISDLRDALPPGAAWVDAAERRAIQTERERTHALRFEEFEDD